MGVGDYIPYYDNDGNWVYEQNLFYFGPGSMSAGGGGGGYNEILIPLSSLAATVTVTVGGGGAAGGLQGGDGNLSSFGSHAVVYGGGGGLTNIFGTATYGGYGGSALYAGVGAGFNTTYANDGSRYLWRPDLWSGGKGSDRSNLSRRAASTIFGGAGGACGLVANTNGLSVYGGRGGNQNEAGQIPGGGGGGTFGYVADSGYNGAAGRVIVTVF
jgi:hypothetical protein